MALQVWALTEKYHNELQNQIYKILRNTKFKCVVILNYPVKEAGKQMHIPYVSQGTWLLE